LIAAAANANGGIMARLTSICVYCGSASGRNPAYAEAARTLGRAMAEHGIALIYGGGSVGLMGETARAALDHGGTVVGIIPRFLLAREELMPGLTETIVTEDMHQRKMLMFDRADAFVALPGGVGTLEELVEQMTWAQLGRHRKPVLLANIEGFWDALARLLDQMREAGFIRYGLEVSCLIAERAEDVVPMLIKAAAERPEAELEKTTSDGALGRM
jgi:uncharacterized protein (TIGR00730 family)